MTHLQDAQPVPACTCDSTTPTPLLCTAAQAAALCSCSLRQWWRMSASLKTPAPVLLGQRRRWRHADIAAWCAAGCPDRESLERLRQEGPP
ncbi:MAG: helix-turn-helix transcriptional regulator [Phycisphaerae bacterium]